MNRLLSLSIILALVLFSSSCGAKKPPEQAAIKSKNVLTALREMNASYEKKDLDAFLAAVSRDFQGREAFAAALQAVFAKYDAIHFEIQYKKMLITIGQKGEVKVTFTWHAEWLTAGGSALKDGGRVTLVFEPENDKLVSISGKNPFLAQPGETPGKQ
jgi:hypothetical protein